MSVELVCGCTPLHLATFLRARLHLRFPGSSISVTSGIFGDLDGNLTRACDAGRDGVVAVIEWSDLDSRLGYRSSALWEQKTLDDIEAHVADRCVRLEGLLTALAGTTPVVVAGPGLPLPPLDHFPPARSSSFELRLAARVSDFLSRLGGLSMVRVVSSSTLATMSSPGDRYDLAADLRTGFPYTLSHADALADLAVTCLFPQPARKGLITDLDGTLWKGILGDVGVGGVSWTLDDKSHEHAIYQNLLASLAASGVLLAVASKNDPELVTAALQRRDLLVSAGQFFPVEANWGVKSASIRRILERWNVGADSVVFVDDSPMELAEVAEAHPGLECIQFPAEPSGLPALIRQLRDRFGKSSVLAEDLLRQASIRAAADAPGPTAPEGGSEDFSRRLGATLTVEPIGSDGRALELVNKTNQFNLNGERYTEAAWRALLARPGTVAATIAYEDRFGPLGRIGVVAGRVLGDVCEVDVWVLSCRAFSRHVEFHVVQQLFDRTSVQSIRFRHTATARNGLLQAFLTAIGARPADDGVLVVDVDVFRAECPPLFHKVIDTWTS